MSLHPQLQVLSFPFPSLMFSWSCSPSWAGSQPSNSSGTKNCPAVGGGNAKAATCATRWPVVCGVNAVVESSTRFWTSHEKSHELCCKRPCEMFLPASRGEREALMPVNSSPNAGYRNQEILVQQVGFCQSGWARGKFYVLPRVARPQTATLQQQAATATRNASNERLLESMANGKLWFTESMVYNSCGGGPRDCQGPPGFGTVKLHITPVLAMILWMIRLYSRTTAAHDLRYIWPIHACTSQVLYWQSIMKVTESPWLWDSCLKPSIPSLQKQRPWPTSFFTSCTFAAPTTKWINHQAATMAHWNFLTSRYLPWSIENQSGLLHCRTDGSALIQRPESWQMLLYNHSMKN